jgi:hypothetical protein
MATRKLYVSESNENCVLELRAHAHGGIILAAYNEASDDGASVYMTAKDVLQLAKDLRRVALDELAKAKGGDNGPRQ